MARKVGGGGDARGNGSNPGTARKHRETLRAIFEEPTRANIPWRSIEALFLALGGMVGKGQGSRIRVSLNGVRAVFHRPHPRKETNRGAVESVRLFLRNAGFGP